LLSVRVEGQPNYFQLGFSLLELTVVICLIGILFAASAVQYQKHVDKSKAEILNFQAKTFKRTIENVHAISVLQNTRVVDLGTGFFVGVNEQGWPLAASSSSVVEFKNATKSGCFSLWVTLFSNSAVKNDSSSTFLPDDFGISLEDNYICRYKQFGKQEESNFLDYDVRTGNVVATFQ